MEVTGHPSKTYLASPSLGFVNMSNFYHNNFHNKHFQNQMKIWSSHLLDNLSNCLMNLKNSGDSTASLQITFSYKPVICQARDEVWPDMQPVWSDITFVFLKWKYIFLFRVMTDEPSQHVRSDSEFASQNPQICQRNVRCPALICRLAGTSHTLSNSTLHNISATDSQ